MPQNGQNEQEPTKTEEASQELQRIVGVQIVAWLNILPPGDPLRRDVAAAALLCRNSFVPKCCKDKPMETLFVIQRGRELGMTDTMSLQQLWITQGGKLGMEAAAVRSLLSAKDFSHSAFITTDKSAAVIVARPGIDIDPIVDKYIKDGDLKSVGGKGWFISYWDLERVKKIKTRENGKNITLNQTNRWESHPAPLYRHRGLTEAGREVAADLLGGLYSMDEIDEIVANEQAAEQVTPVTVESLEAKAGTGADGADKIDQSIIRPEDETRLRQVFAQAGCTGADVTAALLTIQEEAKTAEEASNLIDQEITKLKAIIETPVHDSPRRRRSKPNPMKKAGKPPEKPPTNGPEGSEFLQAEDAEDILADLSASQAAALSAAQAAAQAAAPEDKPMTSAVAEDTGSDGEPAQAQPQAQPEAQAKAEKQEPVAEGWFDW